jgi:hypothetical protein
MMINVLRLLQDLDSTLKITGESGGIKEKICMTRCKGRFGQPTSGGWADIMINFYFEDDEEKHAHICEIQLVHAHLYGVRKNMGAHKGYNEFRAALELCERLGVDPEEGSDPAILEALKWVPGPQASTAARLERTTTRSEIGRGNLVAALDLQTEKIATLEAQNDKMATRIGIFEAQNEEMAAQMKKMAAVLATLTQPAVAGAGKKNGAETTAGGAGSGSEETRVASSVVVLTESGPLTNVNSASASSNNPAGVVKQTPKVSKMPSILRNLESLKTADM